ncbi:hypothetical protein, partial [Bradyrhizobium yuanmingense]|uniref:hypothetical protein n=1 Tax=Bradyrhizobium yuanmingense TaxID=108015 RepID=UPI0023B8BBD3
VIIKGGDLLSFFETWPINFIGSLSATLLRTAYLKRVVPALASAGSELVLNFDLALYASILRHGDLGLMCQVLCAERLHSSRYAKVDVHTRRPLEKAVVVRMIGQLGGERAPWPGSVRLTGLALPALPPAERDYTEFPMTRLLHVQTLTQT